MAYRGDNKLSNINDDIDYSIIAKLGLIGVAAAGIGFVAVRFKTCQPHQYLVRTGLGIKDIQIGRQFVKWPYQQLKYIDVTPSSLRFSLEVMSQEKLPFTYPGVYTIGSGISDQHLTNYARYMLNLSDEEREKLIMGIIEGRTRIAAANTPIETIFSGRHAFKEAIKQDVEQQLEQYGLVISSANIEELTDPIGSDYFKVQSDIIKSRASNDAKVQVAERVKDGDIGDKSRKAETRIRVAEIEAATVISENERNQQIVTSKATLAKLTAEQDQIANQAKIASELSVKLFQAEKERELEAKKLDTETERKRAETLSVTRVNAERLVKETEGKAQAIRLEAEAQLTKAQNDAEAVKVKLIKEAEGKAIAIEIEAKAKLVQAQNEAEGIKAKLNAESIGTRQLIDSLGGDPNMLLQLRMTSENGLYEKLARTNADAVKGLNPNMTIWSGNGQEAMQPLKELVKTFVPMLDTVQNQTGYKLPDWIIKKEDKKDVIEMK